MGSQVEVRIRHEDEARAVTLCTWDPHDLQGVIRLIRSWGIYVSGAEMGPTDPGDVSGQFVVAESEAYFEVIVSPAEVLVQS